MPKPLGGFGAALQKRVPVGSTRNGNKSKRPPKKDPKSGTRKSSKEKGEPVELDNQEDMFARPEKTGMLDAFGDIGSAAPTVSTRTLYLCTHFPYFTL